MLAQSTMRARFVLTRPVLSTVRSWAVGNAGSEREELVDVIAGDPNSRVRLDHELRELEVDDAPWTMPDEVVVNPPERPRIGAE
jgi:hypothetical protein